MNGLFDLSFVRPRRMGPLAAAGLVASALLLAVAAREVLSVSVEAQQWQARRQAAIDAQSIGPNNRRRTQPATSITAEQAKAINAAIAALNTPWPQLLSAIESSRPEAATVLRLEPRPQDATVRVTAQAQDVAVVIDFMQTLAGTAPFVAALPVQQERADAEGRSGIVATFEARWSTQP